MAKFGLLATMEAKPGKENEVEQFLRGALPLVQDEAGTVSWYAIRLGNSKFGIFDTFNDEAGRKAHLPARSRRRFLPKLRSYFQGLRKLNSSISWRKNFLEGNVWRILSQRQQAVMLTACRRDSVST